MKLEVGKYYKTRDGRKVGPMSVWNGYARETDGTPLFNCLEYCGEYWCEDGTHAEPFSHPYPELDLISEWPSDGPVRTVTRREIVDGRYGVVIVSGHRVSIHGCSDHTELRAAAATLIEIADALEDV